MFLVDVKLMIHRISFLWKPLCAILPIFQAYLEQCKDKLKKRKIVNYIDDEIIDENSDIDDAIDN